MPLKINQSVDSNKEITYNNDVKTYSGFYFDTLSGKSPSGANLPWSAIAYNESDGHMLAVGNNGSVTTGTNMLVYSDNGGETWNNLSTTTGLNAWKGIAFGAGKYVAVSSTGTSGMRILYSTVSSPTSNEQFDYITTGIENNNWESIAYGNSYFIAVASSGTNRVMSSKNGTSWSSVISTILSNVSWKSVAYSPELRRFVIVSNDGSGKIAYSNSNPSLFTSWNLSITSQSSVVFNTVIWASKLKIFIAAGNSGKIYTSADGEIWSPIAFSGSNNFQVIIWSQELELIALIDNSTTGTIRGFTGYILSLTNSNVFTPRDLLSENGWTCGIWNRKFGSFSILSSSGASNRILVSKIAGRNHFLDKKYYYDLIETLNLVSFNYYNSNIRISVGKNISIYPQLNELSNFVFSSEVTLPAGIVLDSGTGEISGSPTVSQETKTYKILATFEKQIIISFINIYISKTVEVLSNLQYSNDNIVTDLVDEIYSYPTLSQGTDYFFNYEIMGVSNLNSFPDGIFFNSLDGTIRGIPKRVQPNIQYRITALNSLGSINKVINLTVRVLNTIIQGNDLRGDISTVGEWQGYVSYFYSISEIIGGKINKNYFYESGKTDPVMVFNNILTVATRRLFFKQDNVFYYKKELVFTVFGNYTLDNLESLTLNSNTFLFSNATKTLDINGNTQFVWKADDNINYFPFKDNIFYITGKDSISLIAPQNLRYSTTAITTLVNTDISYTPSIIIYNYNDWIIRKNAMNYEWRSVVWSSQLRIFVSVASTGNNDRVMTSTNGIDWIIRDAGNNNNWYGLAWSPELYLFAAVGITGSGNRVMTSPDGTNWTARTGIPDRDWRAITWSPKLGIFVAVSYDSSGKILRSSNGITWTEINGPAAGWTSIVWSPQLEIFVAVAYTATNPGEQIMTSTDGTNWTFRSTIENQWRSVTWSPELNLFVAVADGGNNPGYLITRSSNGITWNTTLYSNTNAWQSVAWSSELGVFAAVATTGTNDRIMISFDGITWTTKNNLINNSWRSITWSPELRIFLAVASTGTDDRVITSTKPIDIYSNDFSISPQPPSNYLSFNSFNGTISGKTPPFSSDTNYEITVKNRSGSTSTNFRIRNIYSNTNINTGYIDNGTSIREGFIKTIIGNVVNKNFGILEIESLHYERIGGQIIFYFIISGTYYFPQLVLKSIKIGGQSDSTKLIVNSSTYNSGTGRGYNYTTSSYSNYTIDDKRYSRWSWTFPGPLQSGANADLDYGWRLGAYFTPPSTYTSQTIPIFIE